MAKISFQLLFWLLSKRQSFVAFLSCPKLWAFWWQNPKYFLKREAYNTKLIVTLIDSLGRIPTHQHDQSLVPKRRNLERAKNIDNICLSMLMTKQFYPNLDEKKA